MSNIWYYRATVSKQQLSGDGYCIKGETNKSLTTNLKFRLVVSAIGWRKKPRPGKPQCQKFMMIKWMINMYQLLEILKQIMEGKVCDVYQYGRYNFKNWACTKILQFVYMGVQNSVQQCFTSFIILQFLCLKYG